MKNLIYALLIAFISCNNQSNKNKVQIIDYVNIKLDNWHKAASEANYENYFSKMDSISVFIGNNLSFV